MTASPATVLLVDDRRENLTALAAVLEPLGCEVLLAQSGEEALRHLLTHDVAVIVLDVVMPGMDGFETARHIKLRERTQRIPIIFLTAMGGDEQALKAFESGAVDYVTKPFDPAMLRAKVQVFVELHEKTLLLQRQSEMLARRLDAHVEAEVHQLRRMSEAALLINSTLSIETILQRITDTARDLVGAHEAETVLVLEGNWTHVSSSISISKKYEPWRAEGREVDLAPVYALVCERAQPVHMARSDMGADPRLAEFATAAPGHPLLRGWLAAPLRRRTGEVIGLIQVADKVEGEFGETDEPILVQLAQLAAIAIENAELFQAEHEVAATLQRSLLPSLIPPVAGLEVATRYHPGAGGVEVGGDWYDVIALPGGRVMLVVGDVAGRGATAAAVMGQLRIALRAYAVQGQGPAEALASLDHLVQNLNESYLATAACVLLDPATGDMSIANYGHLPPLLIHPDGAPELLEGEASPPVGVPGDRPAAMSGCLEEGGLLLLYTDGLVEERTASIDDGLARLAKVADAGLPIDRFCEEILSQMIGGGHGDDVALLAARRTSS